MTPTTTAAPRARPWLTLMAVIAFGAALAACGSKNLASPADISGQPVRAKTAEGDRVYILTSQWKTFMRAWRSSSSPSRTDLLIDVWAFDATTGKPVWRHRLEAQSRGVNMGRRLIGVDGGVLWVAQPTGLTGLSLKDGSVVADTAKIEAANADLRGLLPKEERYYSFDTGGLRFRAADGREWRLDGATLKASPAMPGPETLAEGKTPPAHITGGNSTSGVLTQGMRIGERWLGMMSEAGAKAAMTNGVRDGVDWTTSPRQRVWRADYGRVRSMGGYQAMQNLRPLEESPEFLNGALLTNGNSQDTPILLFKPDSILVLHQDRLGDQSHLKLTRVTSPLGKPAWTVDLPMQRLESVMPGETSIVLLGSHDEPSPDRSDRLPVDIDDLATIDLTTGAVTTYGFKIPATDEKAIPAGSAPPKAAN